MSQHEIASKMVNHSMNIGIIIFAELKLYYTSLVLKIACITQILS